jgi:hypothetical protein
MTFVSNTDLNAGKSAAISVSVPRETPALAMTTSGTPKRAVKSPPACASDAASRTSPAYATTRAGAHAATTRASSASRRANRPSVADFAA